MRRASQTGDGCIDVKVRDLLWGEKWGARKSVCNVVGLAGDPANIEAIHCNFLTQALETGAGKVEDILGKDAF